MKKFILFSIVISFIACNSNNNKNDTLKNTDLIQQNLKGKVQTLEEKYYSIDSTGKTKSDSSATISEFNEKGYQIKSSDKDSAGNVTSEQTIKHNDDGTFSEVTTMKKGKQTYRLVTEIKDGKYSGGKSYDSTGKQDSYFTDLKTNDYGIVYSGKQHFMNDKIKSTFDMKYDGPNFIGGETTDSTGKKSYSGTVKLNDKGDAIEEASTTLQKDSSKTENMTYKYDGYDDKGNWLQRTTFNEKGKPTKIVKRTYTYYKD